MTNDELARLHAAAPALLVAAKALTDNMPGWAIAKAEGREDDHDLRLRL